MGEMDKSVLFVLSCALVWQLGSANLLVESSVEMLGFEAEKLIRDFNLFPRSDANVVSGGEEAAMAEKVLNLTCVGHHAGYYPLPHSHAARLFYFFFESRNDKKNDPVVMWLGGGPVPGGCSELALFYENGPFKIADNMSLVWNDYGWDTASNLLYVDQPVGTGFSHTSDWRDIRHNQDGVSGDLYDFVQAFFAGHPEFATNDLYITGQSYASHYIPAFASRLHRGNKARQGIHINLKGLAIGNGLTDPAVQFKSYTDYALDMGIITEMDYDQISRVLPICEMAIKLCGSDGTASCVGSYFVCNTIFNAIMTLAGDINYYDIRKKCEGRVCYDLSNMETYLKQKWVRSAMGVGDIDFVSCSRSAYMGMVMEFMRNLETGIGALLEDGVKLLVYAGEYDLMCNWLGNWRWVHGIEWSGRKEFVEASEVPFKVDDGYEAGILKTHGPLTFLKVHDAGHMVPMDQPEAALEMLKKWTTGSLSGYDHQHLVADI